jgi:hypothetical protein
MADPILCPNCRSPLRVPAEFQLAWLTCANCHSVVPNPGVPASSPDPPPAAPKRAERPPAPAKASTCPHCKKPTQEQWLFCPYCELPLRSPVRAGPGPGRYRPSTEGRRTFYAVIGGTATAVLLLITGSAFARGDWQPLAILIGVLAVMVLVSSFRSALRSDGEMTVQSFGWVVFNVLTLIGVLAAVGFLLGLAAIVFALVVCLAGSKC